MSARITMRDVARAVGVSPMTVSRALRDDQTVNAATRAKIRTAAQTLGYVYDTTAQAFRTQKSGFVAVTLPSINNANFAETFRGLSLGLDGTGTQLLLGATNYQIEKEEELVRQLLTRNPEALVITGGAHTPETRAVIKARHLPVIEIWDQPADPLGHVVGFSNADAMDALVRHLADTGRRRLAFVGASQGSDQRGAARGAGVVQSAAKAGLPPVSFLDAGPAPVSMRHGQQLIQSMGRTITEFDALVCVSDPVAFGCLTACQRLGMDVPGDIAITGFGNFELARVAWPTLTTVDVGAREIGAQVATLLRGLFDDPDMPVKLINTATALIEGGTT